MLSQFLKLSGRQWLVNRLGAILADMARASQSYEVIGRCSSPRSFRSCPVSVWVRCVAFSVTFSVAFPFVSFFRRLVLPFRLLEFSEVFMHDQ
jgi:hypothetical protein